MTALPVVNCGGCGVCCQSMGYPPFVVLAGEPEWEALTESQKDEIWAAIRMHRGDSGLPCIWYDAATARCIHHEIRPGVCREFEVGGTDCLEARKRCGRDI
jgi:Fe-S-cluster containining protein